MFPRKKKYLDDIASNEGATADATQQKHIPESNSGSPLVDVV